MKHTALLLLVGLMSLTTSSAADTTSVPHTLVKQVDAKEEFKKLKDKLRGKYKHTPGDSANCRPNVDMTVQLGEKSSATQHHIILQNKTSRTASALVKVDQPDGLRGTQTITAGGVPISPNSSRPITTGTAARIESCSFL